MPNSYFLLFASVSLSISLVAAIRRSQIILIVASLNMAISSSIVLFCALAKATQKVDPLVHGFVIMTLCALANLIFCGVVVLVFRSRGTLRIEDYREFRG